MAYKFNPFTGKLDQVGAGGGGGTPGGSPTQVQFNDGGTFGGDGGLTYNKATDELTLAGDLNLDDGVAGNTTTVQAVTPTQDRTISFPDATGTVALVSGSNGTIQYNDAGTLKGNSDFTVDVDWDNPATTFTALKVNVPDVLQGSADSNLLDLQSGGTSKFEVRQDGDFYAWGGTAYIINSGAIKLNASTATNTRCTFSVSSGLNLNSTQPITWASSASANNFNDADVYLRRDDANILAQRNGTNAQTYRLYNTYTDASNYERGFLKWDSNVFKIGTEAGTGGGSARSLEIELNGSTRAIFGGGNSLTIPSAVSTVFIDCNTYFASTTTANSRALAGNGFAVGSAYTYGFSSTTGASGTQDVALARDSAGVLKVTNGSTGTGYIKQDPVAISALPDPTNATGVGAGTRGFVNDASSTTFAAVVAVGTNDGGSTVVPVYSDGTSWRIG